MVRGMVSPDWRILGHVLTPVAGSRDRVQGSEPSLNPIHRLYLRKEYCCQKKWEKKAGRAKEKHPLQGLSKNQKFQRFSEVYYSILGLSQPHTCTVETLPQVNAGPLVLFSTEISSENRLQESHRVFQPMILVLPSGLSEVGRMG